MTAEEMEVRIWKMMAKSGVGIGEEGVVGVIFEAREDVVSGFARGGLIGGVTSVDGVEAEVGMDFEGVRGVEIMDELNEAVSSRAEIVDELNEAVDSRA